MKYFYTPKKNSATVGKFWPTYPTNYCEQTPVQTGRGAHPASSTMGTGSSPWVKGPGSGVDQPPHLAPRLNKEYFYTGMGRITTFRPTTGRIDDGGPMRL